MAVSSGLHAIHTLPSGLFLVVLISVGDKLQINISVQFSSVQLLHHDSICARRVKGPGK
jgi:hypothetical protein